MLTQRNVGYAAQDRFDLLRCKLACAADVEPKGDDLVQEVGFIPTDSPNLESLLTASKRRSRAETLFEGWPSEVLTNST